MPAIRVSRATDRRLRNLPTRLASELRWHSRQFGLPMSLRPSRRWLQFNLRTLLVLMFLVFVPLGWLAARHHQKQRERGAVNAIENIGGQVSYSLQYDENDSPAGPAWLRQL